MPVGNAERPRRVHIVGGGPVGLLLAALLQAEKGFDIHLYEKRSSYTRTRMVKLSPYLVADSIDAYRDDDIDGENVDAVFEPWELEESLAFRQGMSPAVRTLLENWTQGFCRLNEIEQALSDLLDAPGVSPVQRSITELTAQDVEQLVTPGDVVIDCSGRKSVLREHLVPPDDRRLAPDNVLDIRLEYAAVITFLYGRPYECNEYCKYYKNMDNTQYKFIPAVDRTVYDDGVCHVTGIVNISERDYEAMPPTCNGEFLREHFPGVAASMDRFIDKVTQETDGDVVGDLEVIRIPLNLYRAVNATSRRWKRHGDGNHPFATSPVFLAGDSAIGSPYFQSISLGFECAMFLAGLLLDHDDIDDELLDRYELLLYKQWLRVYMRSKLIKHNKDLFESLDDTFGLLEKLHIY
jgi:2-polyprenyl-6-methoxyphenol hydroxylase-like FAD-dependent oxidoreductase